MWFYTIVIGLFHVNIEAILKWLVPTNVTEVRSFVVVVQYLQNILAFLSIVATPLHAITTNGKSF